MRTVDNNATVRNRLITLNTNVNKNIIRKTYLFPVSLSTAEYTVPYDPCPIFFCIIYLLSCELMMMSLIK